MVYEGLLDLSHLHIVILCIPSKKRVLQYFNPEISKLHSPDNVFSTVYVLILEEALVPKILIFFVFEAYQTHPLSRSFTSTHFPVHVFSRDWASP